MRIVPPEGGQSIFDHQPDLFAAFNRLYGALWTLGDLEQPVKEAARIRNARVVDCGGEGLVLLNRAREVMERVGADEKG